MRCPGRQVGGYYNGFDSIARIGDGNTMRYGACKAVDFKFLFSRDHQKIFSSPSSKCGMGFLRR